MYININTVANDISYSEKIKCEKIIKNDKTIYKYVDSEKNNIEIIVENKDSVMIKKNGEISYTQMLKQSKKTMFTLKTHFFSCDMEVFAKKINIKNNKIYLEYHLYNDGELVNNITFRLREE